MRVNSWIACSQELSAISEALKMQHMEVQPHNRKSKCFEGIRKWSSVRTAITTIERLLLNVDTHIARIASKSSSTRGTESVLDVDSGSQTRRSSASYLINLPNGCAFVKGRQEDYQVLSQSEMGRRCHCHNGQRDGWDHGLILLALNVRDAWSSGCWVRVFGFRLYEPSHSDSLMREEVRNFDDR